MLKPPSEPHISISISKEAKKKTTLIFDMDETLIHAEPYNIYVHNN